MLLFCAMAAVIQLFQADDLKHAIGVNIHLAYMDGQYRDAGKIIDALDYMDVHSVRDSPPTPDNASLSRYGMLASKGVHFVFMLNRPDMAAEVNLISEFSQEHPRAVEALEGPNEVNNFPVVVNGRSDRATEVEYQAGLYRTIKADPILSALPVYNLTDWPDLGGPADYGNVHTYAKHGDQPGPTLSADLAAQQQVEPGKPLVITEAGYYSLPKKTGWGGVDERTQAIYIINLLLDAFSKSVKNIYIYQLLDAYPDPAAINQEKHFGLFRLDYTPKPAADAVKRLNAILEPIGPQSSRAAAVPNIEGLPSTAHAIALRRGDGSIVLVIWNESRIWDPDALTSIAIKATPISLRFSQPVHNVQVHDLVDGQILADAGRDSRTRIVNLGASPLAIVVGLH